MNNKTEEEELAALIEEQAADDTDEVDDEKRLWGDFIQAGYQPMYSPDGRMEGCFRRVTHETDDGEGGRH